MARKVEVFGNVVEAASTFEAPSGRRGWELVAAVVRRGPGGESYRRAQGRKTMGKFVKSHERKTHRINVEVDDKLRWRRVQIRGRRTAAAER